jgi:hypothetical protein
MPSNSAALFEETGHLYVHTYTLVSHSSGQVSAFHDL